MEGPEPVEFSRQPERSVFTVRSEGNSVFGTAVTPIQCASSHSDSGFEPQCDRQLADVFGELTVGVGELRGKEFVSKMGNSRRYQSTPKGLKAMAALAVPRDKALKPLLAVSCQSKLSPEEDNTVSLDQHYENIRCSMKGLFGALGIAA